jgi:hypothetical protein
MLGVLWVFPWRCEKVNGSFGVGVTWKSTGRTKVVGYLSVVVVLFYPRIYHPHLELVQSTDIPS